jgi:hypothetical protein
MIMTHFFALLPSLVTIENAPPWSICCCMLCVISGMVWADVYWELSSQYDNMSSGLGLLCGVILLGCIVYELCSLCSGVCWVIGSVHALALSAMTAFAKGQEIALPCLMHQLNMTGMIP